MRVTFERLDNKTSREIGGKGVSARKQRITTASGDRQGIWSIELKGSFETDLTYVFGRNVEKARRENKRVTGSPDGIAAQA